MGVGSSSLSLPSFVLLNYVFHSVKVIDSGLVQVMESVLRFVFIEHLNNVKSAKYWGPDAPRLVFQFEVQYISNIGLIFIQTLVDEKAL